MSMRLGDTPVPIPNTMVKTWSADGTILETVWESRWMPMHCFLSEDERKRSLRLENKYTLRSEAEQWCYHKWRLHQIFLWKGWKMLKFESLSLICREVLCMMYLENCIPNEKLYKYFIIRHPRILIERLIFLNNKNKFLNIVYDTR